MKAVKGLRLLIADDHELVRQGIRATLQAHRGWKVVGEAVNGDEAVRKTRDLRPDLAILDITMPELDGLEATRRIQKVAPDTKVLIVTMHESDQMVRRVLEAGARGYVLKSDLATQLVKAVGQVSEGRVFLTPKVSEIVLRGFLEQKKENPLPEREEKSPTVRETEVIRLLAEGKSNKQISAMLGIAVRTVETHRAKIMLKLKLHSIVELVHYATRRGIVTLPPDPR
jgi:DNA-binding NarL/FixJ family response regulator